MGPYQLVERIGVGGMAEVFKATQTGEQGFERVVAVKRILPEVAADESFVAMFIDEAKIAVQLSHPNIAQIYDLGREGDIYFIAQEYVHGRDMGIVQQRQLATGGPLPIPFVVHVGLKVAEALSHAHTAKGSGGGALNLIHRDVSPQNILVSFEGAVKVIDFGLAKAAGRAVQTDHGVVKGKLAYLSAEQAQGREIDSRSDLFSLGTCLFEWLTGKRLFLRTSDVETVLAVQRAAVPDMRALRPALQPGLEAIVRCALERDPARRFRSAAELHESLLSYAYESGLTLRRKGFAGYVRALFPEELAPLAEEPPVEQHDPWEPFTPDEDDALVLLSSALIEPETLERERPPSRPRTALPGDVGLPEAVVPSLVDVDEADSSDTTHLDIGGAFTTEARGDADDAVVPEDDWDDETADHSERAEVLAARREARSETIEETTSRYPREVMSKLIESAKEPPEADPLEEDATKPDYETE